MKKIGFVLLFAFGFLIVYNIFLFIFPLKKTVFYTNEERIEEFVYGKETYPTVIVGSSLSGVFEGKKLFKDKYFNLYLPFTGASTGITVLKRSNKIPKNIFIEINHINRGVDSSLIYSIFNPPIYNVRRYLPFLQTKNKIFPNLIDRVKKPANNKVNQSRPSEKLFNELLQKAQAEWSQTGDTSLLNDHMEMVKYSVAEFADKGSHIFFYEMPMDSSLTNSVLIKYQRNYFTNLALQKGYTFIGADKTRQYQTGDGVHLLKDEATAYTDYFINELSKSGKADFLFFKK